MFDSFSSGMGGLGAMNSYGSTNMYSSMNMYGSGNPMDSDTFGAQLVTQTLDTMNQDPFGSGSNNSYQFQKDVLSAAYSGAGALVNQFA